MHPEEITLKWLGAGGFELRFKNRVVLLDPFLSRPYDASPRLPVTRRDYKKFDALLATHTQSGEFADIPHLAATVDAPAYMPLGSKKEVKKTWRKLHRSARTGNPDNWHFLENTGRIKVGELTATPLKATRDIFDVGSVWEMVKKLASHSPRDEAIRRGMAMGASNPYGPSWAMQLDWRERVSRMLFFGSLSRHVHNVTPETGHTDVLALPYDPVGRQWMKETSRLIQRFQPRAVLLHRFDGFLPPITGKSDLDLRCKKMRARFPGLPLYIPKPLKEFTLEDVLAGK